MSVPLVLRLVRLVDTSSVPLATGATKVAAVLWRPVSVTTSRAGRNFVSPEATMPSAIMPGIAIVPSSGSKVKVYVAARLPRLRRMMRWLYPSDSVEKRNVHRRTVTFDHADGVHPATWRKCRVHQPRIRRRDGVVPGGNGRLAIRCDAEIHDNRRAGVALLPTGAATPIGSGLISSVYIVASSSSASRISPAQAPTLNATVFAKETSPSNVAVLGVVAESITCDVVKAVYGRVVVRSVLCLCVAIIYLRRRDRRERRHDPDRQRADRCFTVTVLTRTS